MTTRRLPATLVKATPPESPREGFLAHPEGFAFGLPLSRERRPVSPSLPCRCTPQPRSHELSVVAMGPSGVSPSHSTTVLGTCCMRLPGTQTASCMDRLPGVPQGCFSGRAWFTSLLVALWGLLIGVVEVDGGHLEPLMRGVHLHEGDWRIDVFRYFLGRRERQLDPPQVAIIV